MAKIYSLISSTDYTAKNYHLVEYIQNKPFRAKDHNDAQGLLLQKYHSDLEKLIGIDPTKTGAFLIGSGTGLTINTDDSKYYFDGAIAVDGLLFDFDEYTIHLDSITNDVDNPIIWNSSISEDGAFWLKLEISSTTYLEDSTIALRDSVTPTYIETSTRKTLTPKIIWSTESLIDTTDTLYRKLTEFSYEDYKPFKVDGLEEVELSEMVKFFTSTGFYDSLGSKIEDLFENNNEVINDKRVVLISPNNFSEYPAVTGCVTLNISEGTGYADPGTPVLGANTIKLKWDDMTNSTESPYDVDYWRSVQSYVGYILLINTGDFTISSFPKPFVLCTAETDPYMSLDFPDNWPLREDPELDAQEPAYLLVNDTRGLSDIQGSRYLYWADAVPANGGMGIEYNLLKTTLTVDFDGTESTMNVSGGDIKFWPDSGTGYFADGSVFTYSAHTDENFTITSSTLIDTQITNAEIICGTKIRVEDVLLGTLEEEWTYSDNTIALSQDKLGQWYKAFEIKDTYIEFEAPKDKIFTLWVGAKIRDILNSKLVAIPSLSKDNY